MLHKTSFIAILIFAALITGKISPVQAQAKKESNIHYLTDTCSGFNSLITQFKGKVIYVDIWATWCHPCRAELVKRNDIKAFGDFAMKHNVVLLYICCDRNTKSWKSFISQNQLAGYHAFDNDELNKDLHERFSYAQTGRINLKKGFYIPRYMIIDQVGAIVDSLAGPQGDKAVYACLNKLLVSKAN